MRGETGGGPGREGCSTSMKLFVKIPTVEIVIYALKVSHFTGFYFIAVFHAVEWKVYCCCCYNFIRQPLLGIIAPGTTKTMKIAFSEKRKNYFPSLINKKQ
jgi:hypothetical protein